jgi:ribosomal protein S2
VQATLIRFFLDDSIRSIDLYCSIMENAVLRGIQRGLVADGVDVGSLSEQLPDDAVATKPEDTTSEPVVC